MPALLRSGVKNRAYGALAGVGWWLTGMLLTVLHCRSQQLGISNAQELSPEATRGDGG